jgi:hypothetical protein
VVELLPELLDVASAPGDVDWGPLFGKLNIFFNILLFVFSNFIYLFVYIFINSLFYYYLLILCGHQTTDSLEQQQQKQRRRRRQCPWR